MINALKDVAEALGQLGALEVWLFGSHANGKAGPESDVDLLVVGPRSLLEELRVKEAWPYDIFVNISGEDEFCSPWRQASGSYSGWKWRRVAEDKATYIAMKPNKWRPEYAHGFPATAIRIFSIGDSFKGRPRT